MTDARPRPGARCATSTRARCPLPAGCVQRKALRRQGYVKAAKTLLYITLVRLASASTVTASTLAQLANGEVTISSPEHVDSYSTKRTRLTKRTTREMAKPMCKKKSRATMTQAMMTSDFACLCVMLCVDPMRCWGPSRGRDGGGVHPFLGGACEHYSVCQRLTTVALALHVSVAHRNRYENFRYIVETEIVTARVAARRRPAGGVGRGCLPPGRYQLPPHAQALTHTPGEPHAMPACRVIFRVARKRLRPDTPPHAQAQRTTWSGGRRPGGDECWQPVVRL